MGVDQQLRDAALRVKQRNRTLQRQAALKKQLSAERERLRSAETLLRKEEQDVEKLQGLSIRGVFHTIVGDKSEQLTKEQKEVVKAALVYEGLLADVDLLEQELRDTNSQLKLLEDAEREYDQLLEQKKKLLSTNIGAALELQRFEEEITAAESELLELTESVAAGEQAIRSLKRAQDTFEDARSWGGFDLVGGGMLSSLAKQERIDRAYYHLADGYRSIKRFQREMQDVDVHFKQFENTFGDGDRFFDIWADNVITDWSIQVRLKNTVEQITELRKLVADAVIGLRTRRASAESVRDQLLEQRQAFIETTQSS